MTFCLREKLYVNNCQLVQSKQVLMGIVPVVKECRAVIKEYFGYYIPLKQTLLYLPEIFNLVQNSNIDMMN